MFIDGRTVPDSSRLDADICIVGAGAAGLTLARHFAGTQAKVVLLESGGLQSDNATQSLNQGENTGLNYLPLESTRLRYFGGTTNHWAGQSARLDPGDLADRPWVDFSGWPISYDELATYYPEAENILELGNDSYAGDFWQQQSGYAQLALVNNNLETLVFRFSPPVKFGEKYRSLIETSENIDCFLNANLTRFTTDGTAESVQTAQVQCLNGIFFSITARYFILAVGAIENSRLLLLSNDVIPEGLGNRNDLVGRYFMEHPNSHGGQIVWRNGVFPKLYEEYLDIGGVRIKSNLVMSQAIQQSESLLNFSAFFLQLNAREVAARPELTDHVGNFISNFENILRGESTTLAQADAVEGDRVDTQLAIRLEHAPNPESRITLSSETDLLGLRKVRLNLQLGDSEYETYLRFREILVREMGQSNLGRLRLNDFADREDWLAGLGWQYHHMGGTRMHESETRGVVDANCKVHGINNLYIAGSSVFPTGGHANPTITIVALAQRLAEHITARMTP